MTDKKNSIPKREGLLGRTDPLMAFSDNMANAKTLAAMTNPAHDTASKDDFGNPIARGLGSLLGPDNPFKPFRTILSTKEESDTFVTNLGSAIAGNRMNQSKLARAIGTTRQTISQWMHSDYEKRTRPSRDNLEIVANALQTTVVWLLTTHVDSSDFVLQTMGSTDIEFELMKGRMKEYWVSLFPADVASFNRTVNFGKMELTFDYASALGFAEYRPMSAPDASIREALWKLNVAKIQDEGQLVKREYNLFLQGPTDHPRASYIRLEADIANIRILSSETIEETANKYIGIFDKIGAKAAKGPLFTGDIVHGAVQFDPDSIEPVD